MLFKIEDLFYRTFILINEQKIKIIETNELDVFFNWFECTINCEIIKSVFYFEKDRFDVIKMLPSEKLYLENRMKNIFIFEEKVKSSMILQSSYVYNTNTKIISTRLNVDINNFIPNNILLGNNIHNYSIRRSLTHSTGVFEKKLEGWNNLIVDIKNSNELFTGFELLDSIKFHFSDIKEKEVIKFISNNIVYYDTLEIIH
ncbi:hypothetical protein [Yeosuana sp.]|uniref:hypothetical protein n=1 Tax=Yeosuana sp. TaxID=2529388 RepID=UPI00405503D3